ncbi:MAG: tRNA (adenosine(37)-N6)-threonylcarbamoyltransferase complex dimerization subunit type 1 TsaB [Ruminococcus sp.]
MRILAFDSTATAASVAVVEENKIIGEFFINTKLTHSQTLLPMAESLLNNTQLSVNDIDAFAVNAGPGSFTGVRIGVAAVKGMAMALNKSCVAVSTLESMAYNLKHTDCTAICVMDARCNQVYNANFKISGGNIQRLCEDRAISIDELTEELKGFNDRLILVGDGSMLCYEKMQDKLTASELASESLRYQNAVSTAFIALNLYKSGKFVSASELMPYYLRMPQAERELKKRKENEKK